MNIHQFLARHGLKTILPDQTLHQIAREGLQREYGIEPGSEDVLRFQETCTHIWERAFTPEGLVHVCLKCGRRAAIA